MGGPLRWWILWTKWKRKEGRNWRKERNGRWEGNNKRKQELKKREGGGTKTSQLLSHRKPILRQNETEQGLTIPFGRRSLILIEIIGYKSFVIPRGDLTNGGRGVCVEALPLLASFEPPPQDRLSRNSELSRRRRRRASRRREEGLGGFLGGRASI